MKKRTELQAALKYAKKGWRTFPCKLNKRPLIYAWQKIATTNRERIKKWWRQWPTASVGVVCGKKSGLVVLDIDKKSGGFESLKKLKREHFFPVTLKARTGGGGVHYYFQYPDRQEVRNSAGKIAKGIDVRGEGGYVVVPPSRHPSGKRYKWINENKIKPLPDGLLEKITEKEVVEEAIVKGERHVTLTSLAGKYRNSGLNQKQIETLLLMDNERCSPPHDIKDIKRIAKDIAIKDAGREIELIDAEDIKELNLEWLWPNKMPFAGLSLIIGYEDVGKTWIVGDIAYRVSSGRRWPDGSGRAKEGKVIICTNEAHMKGRFIKQLNIAGAEMSNIKFLDMKYGKQFNFEEDFERLKQTIKELGDVRLIIFDPLLQYMVSAGKGMKTLEYADSHIALGRITEWLEDKDLAVIGTNHLTKGDIKDTRRMVDTMHGSTSYKAKCSTIWCVTSVPDEKELREFVFGIGNVCVRPVTGKAFRLTDDYKLHWQSGNITADIEERRAEQRQQEKPAAKKQQCKDFIMEEVLTKKNRKVTAVKLQWAVLQKNFTMHTFEAARAELKKEEKIDCKKREKMLGGWVWWRL